MTSLHQWYEEWIAEGSAPAPSNEERLPGLALIRSRGRWILLGAVVGLLLGIAALPLRPPIYESTAYITVTVSSRQDPVTLSRAAQALARLGTAPGIVSGPLSAAGLPEAARTPREFVNVQAAPNAPLISVTARAQRPQAAQWIAITVANTLSNLNAVGPLQVAVVSTPQLPGQPMTPRWWIPVGALAIGIALAVALTTTIPDHVSFGHVRTPKHRPVVKQVPSLHPLSRTMNLGDEATPPGE